MKSAKEKAVRYGYGHPGVILLDDTTIDELSKLSTPTPTSDEATQTDTFTRSAVTKYTQTNISQTHDEASQIGMPEWAFVTRATEINTPQTQDASVTARPLGFSQEPSTFPLPPDAPRTLSTKANIPTALASLSGKDMFSDISNDDDGSFPDVKTGKVLLSSKKKAKSIKIVGPPPSASLVTSARFAPAGKPLVDREPRIPPGEKKSQPRPCKPSQMFNIKALDSH